MCDIYTPSVSTTHLQETLHCESDKHRQPLLPKISKSWGKSEGGKRTNRNSKSESALKIEFLLSYTTSWFLCNSVRTKGWTLMLPLGLLNRNSILCNFLYKYRLIQDLAPTQWFWFQPKDTKRCIIKCFRFWYSDNCIVFPSARTSNVDVKINQTEGLQV